MHAEPLTVRDALVITPTPHSDDRGTFLEWFRGDLLTEAGAPAFELAQANISVSTKGVLRGIHYADVPPGQAKYVTCVRGAVLDVVVDLRVGSATFGQWASVRLDAESRKAVYLPEGLGHGFFALEDDATVAYLCSTSYNPAAEHGINPFDADLAITWPAGLTPLVSPKDAQAPGLMEAREARALPTIEQCRVWYSRGTVHA